MSDLKLVQTIVASFKNDIRTLVEKRLELFSLQATEAVSEVLAGLIPKIIGALFLAVSLTLLMFALGMFINEVYESEYLGFLVVGGAMLLVALPLVIAKNAPWNTSIRNTIISQMTAAMDSEPIKETKANPSQENAPLLEIESASNNQTLSQKSQQRNGEKNA